MALKPKDLLFPGDLYADESYINYLLKGTEGNDRLFGNGGDDKLMGYEGNDRLWGGDGDDVLNGGQGSDILFIDRGNNSYDPGSANMDIRVQDTDTLAFYDVVTYGADVWGVTIWSHEYKEFTVGFNVDIESGVTLSQANSGAVGYTDNWGTNQFTQPYDYGLGTMEYGFSRIEMTNENDIVRDSDLPTEILGRGGNDTLEGRGGGDFLRGGSGTDTASYESASSGIEVNLLLNRGMFNDAEGDTYESIENLIGSGFDDRLSGNNGANRIEGRGGDDTLLGSGGADRLIGGSGEDSFMFLRTSDSTVAAGGRDSILDFQIGQDSIDLRAIDARSASSGDDLFSFIGSRDFMGIAGQLRSSSARDESGSQFNLVQGDVNGDGSADFSIAVYSGWQALSSSDFIL